VSTASFLPFCAQILQNRKKLRRRREKGIFRTSSKQALRGAKEAGRLQELRKR